MAGELLLDTGALVSLLDRSQPAHPDVSRFFAAWDGKAVSTEAVLTEATHLLGRVAGGIEACLSFFLQGGAVLVPPSIVSLRRARELLIQYADLPMGYADATLVVLAEELGISRILTTDKRDFGIYRRAGRTRWRPVQCRRR